MLKSNFLLNWLPAFLPLQKKQALLKPIPSKWFLAGGLLIVLNGFLFFSYLLGVNNYSSTGHEIKQLQLAVSEQTEKNKQFNLEIAEMSSLSNVLSDLTTLNFVTAETPQFLEINALTQK